MVEKMVRKRFSQREGVKPSKDIQINSLDIETRNRIWNAISKYYFEILLDESFDINKRDYLRWKTLLEDIWDRLFKESLEFIHRNDPKNIYDYLKDYTLSHEWYEIYDLIEFVAETFVSDPHNVRFKKYCNSVLKEESTGYRFVGGRISSITSEEEIAEIEEALTTPFDPINDHIQRALELMSDRRSPDYRNSIKESISAVEFVCKLIIGERDSTLGRAISKLEQSGLKLHEDQKEGWKKLYHWTSDDSGIRHAIMDKPRVDLDDAKYMLVNCSAFVIYLISQSVKAGITLEDNFQRIRSN